MFMNKSVIYVALSCCCMTAFAQYKTAQPKGAGDLIESTSYNDHKRGAGRGLNYIPDGNSFLCVNGVNRYTRALYGGHSAWRLETSDRPIFATYLKNGSRNIRFSLSLPDGRSLPLEELEYCEARYIPGSRTYKLRDSRLPGCELSVAALADTESETGLWRFIGDGLPDGTTIEAFSSHIRLEKLSRNGDMGADPPGCFNPSESDDALVAHLSFRLSSGSDVYVAASADELTLLADGTRFAKAQRACDELAGQVVIKTPDPFLNTLGGALSVAADGIWGEEGVWLHGAIGWRMPLSGWRAAYTGDCVGWHDRARTHFDNYAASQVTDVPNTIPHPAQDSVLALARSEKRWGTPQYSNGYICRNPRRNDQMHHYDMNLCYIDELLWHLNWTGDIDYARSMWKVITAHLKWEKLNYDPDDDGLYDAYACIWASDALYYSGGAATHSTAYNYRANRMAAMIAEKIGEDPTPYKLEADKILRALNSTLWMPEKGHWAECKDALGYKRLHESAALWTIYHSIDSDIATPFQAYMATRYVDDNIPHIPVTVSSDKNVKSANDYSALYDKYTDEINRDGYAVVSTTNWMPYAWSINNVAFAEVMHTALAYFEAERPDEGFKLMKSLLLDGMYLGESPGNFGQISFYDAARGECYRDFGDPIGVASRAVIQGLYGILPDAMNKRLLIKPGFPHDWEFASMHTPDIDFDFKTDKHLSSGSASVYTLTHRLDSVCEVELRIPAVKSMVSGVTVNGKVVGWCVVDHSIGRPMISLSVAANSGEEQVIRVEWKGEAVNAAAATDVDMRRFGSMNFVEKHQGDVSWWSPEENTPVENGKQSAGYFSDVNPKRCLAVNMDKSFNANVTDIFRNKYLSPRPRYTTLQIPVQGIGEWCHPLQTADIDDSGLRSMVKDNEIETSLGFRFRTPSDGYNVAFTSLWDNYPDSLSVALNTKGTHLYLLMAGSTNHMQSRIVNGVVKVYYSDGSYDTLQLVNPDNWAPIEQFYFEDGKAFDRGLPSLYRLRLKTGEVSGNFGVELGYTGISRVVDGGAALLLDMPVNKHKRMERLVVETLSNDVVIGLMGVTVQR